MTWDYRVVRDEDGKLSVREVYKGDDGALYWDGDPVGPVCENLSELIEFARWIAEAADKPILRVSKTLVEEKS